MKFKLRLFQQEEISPRKFLEILQGWNAYAIWANSFKLRKEVAGNFIP